MAVERSTDANGRSHTEAACIGQCCSQVKRLIITINVILLELETKVQVTSSLYRSPVYETVYPCSK